MKKWFNLESGLRQGSHYLYELECLRGIAILLVFFSHTHGVVFGNSPHSPSLLMSFIVSGNTGVTLFFVLSGFLLSLPWLSYLLGQRSETPNFRHFYLARALRILPLYWVAVIVSVIVTGNLTSGAEAAVFGFVGFEMFPFSVVWWTLATEVQFYILLPIGFAAWIHSRLTRALLLLAFATWLYFYTTLILLGQLPNNQLSYFYNKSIFGRLPAFLFGIVAGWIYLVLKDSVTKIKPKMNARLVCTTLLLVAICALGLVLQAASEMGERFAENNWHIRHTYESLLWATIVLCFVIGKPLGQSLFINRPMAVSGKLSYSLYLVHVPVIFYIIYPSKETMGLEEYSASMWLFINPVLALLASFAISILSYRFIELSFLNLKHKIPSK